MNNIYLVIEYVYDTAGKVVGNDPVVAYESEDAALDFMDTYNRGDEVVEVPFNWTFQTKFTGKSNVVYSGNAESAAEVLTDFFNGKRGKKR